MFRVNSPAVEEASFLETMQEEKPEKEKKGGALTSAW
jgi:hypothetical protein